MSSEGERVELAEYGRIVAKRKWMIIVPTVLVLASAVAVLRYMTPIYISHAVIEIIDRDVVEDVATEVTGGRVNRRQRPRDWDRQKLQQVNQTIHSTPFLEPVGRRLALHEDPSVRRAAERKQARLPDRSVEDIVVTIYTRRLKAKIEVEKAGIDLYRFVCEDEDPRAAYELARAVSEEYQAYTLSTGIARTTRTDRFTRELLEEKQRALAEAEQKLHAFQARMQRTDLSQSNPVTGSNLDETKRLVDEADLELTTIEKRIDRGLERLPPSLGGVAGLEGRVTSDRLQRLSDDLRQAETGQVVLMIQGEGVQRVVGAAVSRIRQDIFVEMRALVTEQFPQQSAAVQKQIGDVIFDRIVVRSVQARRDALKRLLRDFSNRVVRRPQLDLERDHLEGEVNSLRTLVHSLEQKLVTEEIKTEATEEGVKARVRIMEQPEVPVKPDRPDKVRILLLALVAGPLLGLGAVVVTEYLDTSLRTVEDVEEVLGLPVLGTIPKLAPSTTQAAHRRGSARRRRQRAGAAGLVLLLASAVWSGGASAAAGAGASSSSAPIATATGEQHG